MISSEHFEVLSLNASRIQNLDRIRDLLAYILILNPKVCYIQEISIAGAIRIFSSHFQVYVNMEDRAYATDGVGIVTIIKPFWYDQSYVYCLSVYLILAGSIPMYQT